MTIDAKITEHMDRVRRGVLREHLFEAANKLTSAGYMVVGDAYIESTIVEAVIIALTEEAK